MRVRLVATAENLSFDFWVNVVAGQFHFVFVEPVEKTPPFLNREVRDIYPYDRR